MTHPVPALTKFSQQTLSGHQCELWPSVGSQKCPLRRKMDDATLAYRSIGCTRQILEVKWKLHYQKMPTHLPLILQDAVLPLLFSEYVLWQINWKVAFHNWTNISHYLVNICHILILKADCSFCNKLVHLGLQSYLPMRQV